MSKFTVKVRTERQSIEYTAMGSSSADVCEAAIDKYGICSVFVEAM